MKIEQPADVGEIQVHAKRSPMADGKIEVTGCRVTSHGDAHCVWIHATSQPPSEIRLTGNRFERRAGTGTNVAVDVDSDSSLSKLSIRGNLFANGGSALNFALKGRLPPHSVDIVNNTFFQSQYWLAFTTQQPSVPLACAANNLIVGGERILTDTHDDLNEAALHWVFRSNW